MSDDVVFQVPAEVLLHGNDGTVFPMTDGAWRVFTIPLEHVPVEAGPALCADFIEALEDGLADREGEESIASLLPAPVEAFFENVEGVRRLIEFLRSCGGFTVWKVRDWTETMHPGHPRWPEFCERLDGPEGCDFQEDEKGKMTWQCGGGTDQSKAARILKDMGFSPDVIEQSLSFFAEHGGHCDCEILFNVDTVN